MTYSTHAAIASDPLLRGRVTACAATEGVAAPAAWTAHVIWHIIGADWIAAWESWMATHSEHVAGISPGDDGTVVTDQMILSAVQARLESGE